MNSKGLLILAAVLIGVGLFKPDFSSVLHPSSTVPVNIDVSKPSPELMPNCEEVIEALSVDNDRKTDGKKLALLFNDMATLIELDGENEVIKTTEEIRQANKLVGALLKLDVQGKYPDLKDAAQKLLVSQIGDDAVLLDSNLRSKAVDSYKALAWASYEGSK